MVPQPQPEPESADVTLVIEDNEAPDGNDGATETCDRQSNVHKSYSNLSQSSCILKQSMGAHVMHGVIGKEVILAVQYKVYLLN